MFRQLRPKEIVHEKASCISLLSHPLARMLTLCSSVVSSRQSNLSVPTLRALRTILPSSCAWVPIKSFGSPEETLQVLDEFFPVPSDAIDVDGDASRYPPAIQSAMDQPLVLSSLGGLISSVPLCFLVPSHRAPAPWDAGSPAEKRARGPN